MNTVRILTGDALTMLATLPANSVHCVVTSPPYWGLRDYGTAGQIGLEKTPEEYVEQMVAVFREVRRVLRPDGTLWLNIGDSYASFRDAKCTPQTLGGGQRSMPTGGAAVRSASSFTGSPVKHKDLVGIPWRVAFALQADGWWLRSDIIWAKPNPMPESVTDRPTKAHEYIFLLTKSARYFYDSEAVREPLAESTLADGRNGSGRHTQGKNGSKYFDGDTPDTAGADKPSWYRQKTFVNPIAGRNRRTVWTITTSPYPEAHFATFPPKLVEPCILAGTSEHGCCPNCGAPWVRTSERTDEVDATAKGSRFDAGKTGVNGNGRTQPGERFVKVATGWQRTCDHDDEPVPCTVLDPFLGSGTTAEVAVKLGRNTLGIELNPEYVTLARKRIAQALPLLTEVLP